MQVEDVDLAGEDRLIDLAALFDFLQLAEFPRIGEGLVNAILRFDFLFEVLVLAGNVGVPPGQAGGAFEGTNLGFMSGHEFARPLRHLGIRPNHRGGGDHPHGCQNQSHHEYQSPIHHDLALIHFRRVGRVFEAHRM